MSNFSLKAMTKTVKNWYIPLIVGILFIGAGIFVFSFPESTFQTLALLFSLSFIIAGVFEVIFSLANRNEMDNWAWTLIFGLVTFFFGLALTLQPELSMLTLAVFVGLTFMFRSIAAISFAIDIKDYGVSQWGGLMALGIVGVIFSFILLINPQFTGATVVTWIGLSFFAIGLLNIFLSLRLRKVKHNVKKVSKELRDRFDDIIEEIKDELFD